MPFLRACVVLFLASAGDLEPGGPPEDRLNCGCLRITWEDSGKMEVSSPLISHFDSGGPGRDTSVSSGAWKAEVITLLGVAHRHRYSLWGHVSVLLSALLPFPSTPISSIRNHFYALDIFSRILKYLWEIFSVVLCECINFIQIHISQK